MSGPSTDIYVWTFTTANDDAVPSDDDKKNATGQLWRVLRTTKATVTAAPIAISGDVLEKRKKTFRLSDGYQTTKGDELYTGSGGYRTRMWYRHAIDPNSLVKLKP